MIKEQITNWTVLPTKQLTKLKLQLEQKEKECNSLIMANRDYAIEMSHYKSEVDKLKSKLKEFLNNL